MIYLTENISLFDFYKNNPHYSLSHCISSDGRMGAGIALEFTKQFPTLRGKLIKILHHSHVGKMVEYKIPDGSGYIFNLITKEKYHNKPTYETVEQSLKDMYNFCKNNKIQYLAIPMLGSGLDRLNWYKVERILKQVFRDLDIKIVMCYI